MKQAIARGYIKKVKAIKDNKSVSQRFAAYTGELQLDGQDITVEVFTDNENFKNKELFIKLSIFSACLVKSVLY